ncbi:MAG: triose-phosphate isomerase [bacterium]
MARKNIIIANWKMNPVSEKEAEKLFKEISKSVSGMKRTDVVVCAPYLYIEKLRKISKKIALGAQDAAWTDVGAFTGEVSPDMLAGIGAKYVILGHSERRVMGEDNALINKKVKAAIQAGLLPILCVGENERDEKHEYLNLVKAQIKECLEGISKNLISKVIVAYEPVWAISTTANRRDAVPADSLEMAIFVRKTLSDMVSSKIAKDVRILYGGSVNEKDAGDFLRSGGVEGLLVAGPAWMPRNLQRLSALRNMALERYS